jgi:hypothetical protein
MKYGFEKIQPSLVIVIASFLIIYPVYFQYIELTEVDFLSPSPNFENLDPENLLGDDQNKTKMFVFGFSPGIYLFDFFCLGQLPRSSYQIVSLDYPISILRC